ncbi:MAG TPA: T9SS type A sorting domain-containing protein, partial [Aequorivita sp.]|nr:T9SS type A sorting domain-containing protein [Aequorivita sp.]
PNNGSFTIMAKEDIISSLEVYNTLGQRMERTRMALNNQGAQLTGLDSGLYFVKVVFDNARIGTVKVVVK